MKVIKIITALVVLVVFSLGVAELACTFHNPTSDFYLGRISYRCAQ